MGESYGAKLKEARQTLGLSVRELAKRTGLSRGYIYQLEREEYSPTLRSAELIAHALGLTVDEFCSGDAPIVDRTRQLLVAKLEREMRVMQLDIRAACEKLIMAYDQYTKE